MHRAADHNAMEAHVAMNAAVFEEQHGTEEEIYENARQAAADYLENFDESVAEEEERRQQQQAEAEGTNAEGDTVDSADNRADMQDEDEDEQDADQWDDAGVSRHQFLACGCRRIPYSDDSTANGKTMQLIRLYCEGYTANGVTILQHYECISGN